MYIDARTDSSSWKGVQPQQSMVSVSVVPRLYLAWEQTAWPGNKLHGLGFRITVVGLGKVA